MTDPLPWTRPLRDRVTGPLLLLGLVVGLEALERTPWGVPNPTPFLLVAVVYAAFVDPRWKAMLVAVFAVGYTAVHFSRPGALFGYEGDDLYRVLVMAGIAPTMAWMTAGLKEGSLALERESAARERAERERDLVRHVIERAPVAVLVTRGSEHEVVLANASAAHLLDIPTGSMQGRPLRDLLPRVSEDLWQAIEAAARRGASWSKVDVGIGRLDGTTRLAEVAVSPLAGPEGRVAGIVLMAADLTDRRKAEADLAAARSELARSERLVAMGTMVTGLAHEIRTPLTFVANHLSILRGRLDAAKRKGGLPKGLERADVDIDEALAGVDRVNALVVDLRKFVRTEPGERRALDVNVHVAEALRLFQAANRGRVVLETDLRPVPHVVGEPLQIQQIVLNLVENAATATPPGGRVWVSTRSDERNIVLLVGDEGVGMLPEVRARVFDPFFTTREEGTGLGLAIVRRLVEAHGGRIEVESEAGRGSVFRVRFPALRRQVPVEDEPAALNPARR